MKLVRYRLGMDTGYGIVEGDEVHTAEGNLFEAVRSGARLARLDELELLPPVLPTKILAVGKNYAAHAQELESEVPPEPLIFLKANSALNGPKDPIVVPPWAGRIDPEAELVAVIGETT